MAKAKTYRELRAELDTVMTSLEQGDLDIDEAVKCYERGLQIVRELESFLKDAENTVTELKNSVLADNGEEE